VLEGGPAAPGALRGGVHGRLQESVAEHVPRARHRHTRVVARLRAQPHHLMWADFTHSACVNILRGAAPWMRCRRATPAGAHSAWLHVPHMEDMLCPKTRSP